MEPLAEARRQTCLWLVENSDKIARGWKRLQEYRSTIENLPGLDAGQWSQLQRLLRSLEGSAKAAMDTDNYKKEYSPERAEAFRRRTVRAVQTEREHSQG
jgi:hypothetical protein